MILQQQYQERRFSKYSELISCLLDVEKNNELLIKNHESRPTGSTTFLKVNANTIEGYNRSRGHGRGPYSGRGHGCGRGHERAYGYSGLGGYSQNNENIP
ncbi:hypothetical protein Ddye_025563 [Dipteronia dyeriana]|uniref:Uncharacterized protein n=1 Tax=Dipteronia dyeriana TaxID=168575 RepID=A0AAD9TL18_9ROSI|nr:hypothetical protein Ddye_025563 [Dipteronia dyeriana]